MNIYICPECGEKLLLKKEYGFNKVQSINIHTGLLSKRVTKENFGVIDTPIRIECANVNCGFVIIKGIKMNFLKN